jgi:hypothetical protein
MKNTSLKKYAFPIIKNLLSTTILFLILYAALALFFGGKPLRAVNGQLHNIFTYAAEKSRNSSLTVRWALINCRENLCSFVDSVADISDNLGLFHNYAQEIKTEREKEGEKLAESIKQMKKLKDPDSDNELNENK